MDIGDILSRAGQITWKYKILWIFGILAGCGRSSSSFSSRFNSGGRSGEGYTLPDWQQNLPIHWFERFLIEYGLAIMLGLIMLFFVIFIAVFLLSVFGRVGLIQGTVAAENGEEKLSFGQIVDLLRPYYVRALGLNLLYGLGVAVVGFIFFLIAVFGVAVTFGLGMLCILPLVCVLVPVLWLVGIVVQQANVALVVEDLSIMDAFRRGFEVANAHRGEMIVMGLILGIGAGIVAFVVAFPLAFVAVPIFAGLMGGTSNSLSIGLGVAGLCFVVYLPVLLVLSGIIQTFVGSAWTLTFMRFRGDGVVQDKAMLGESPEPA